MQHLPPSLSQWMPLKGWRRRRRKRKFGSSESPPLLLSDDEAGLDLWPEGRGGGGRRVHGRVSYRSRKGGGRGSLSCRHHIRSTAAGRNCPHSRGDTSHYAYVLQQ